MSSRERVNAEVAGEEAVKILGDRFSAKTVHLLFIKQGTIPAGYFRDELLGEIRAMK